MKAIPLVLAAVMALAASVRSQEEEKAAPPEGTTLPATARILGDISDGTPPPPAEAKPAFVVPANDILSTTTHQQGGRTITIQRIKPIALPPPLDPAPAPAEVALDETARQERVAALRAKHPEWELLILGVTVFRSTDSPPRTLVNYRTNKTGEIRFWSSADFGLLSGFSEFVAANGRTYSLLMMSSNVDVTRMEDLHGSRGSVYAAPAMPDFPDGKASYALAGNPPADPEALVPIQALHDIYNNEFARLKAAYDSRERMRIQREAKLKANPPGPKNITLHYWRIGGAAPEKGGAK